MMKTAIIIQARMASSRLPGKVLLDIGGKPMLGWVVERASRAVTADKVVVATTSEPSDDQVFEFCQEMGYLIERGSSPDVLDRYYQTAKANHAEIICRITADCPLIDPELIDSAVTVLKYGMEPGANVSLKRQPRYDFAANRLPAPFHRTYPIGLDIEVMTLKTLAQAWEMAGEKHQREHVTPYIYEDIPVDELQVQYPITPLTDTVSPKGYRVALMHQEPDFGDLRWTVDTPEDLEFVRKVISFFEDDRFNWKDVLGVVKENPELSQINTLVEHKTHFDVDDRE